MTPEQKLAALFAADAPPVRDLAFEVALAERIARRRAWRRVFAGAPYAVAGAAGLWAMQPALALIGADLQQSLTGQAGQGLAMAGLALAAGLAAMWASRRLASI